MRKGEATGGPAASTGPGQPHLRYLRRTSLPDLAAGRPLLTDDLSCRTTLTVTWAVRPIFAGRTDELELDHLQSPTQGERQARGLEEMLTIVTREQAGLVPARVGAPVMDRGSLIGLALHHSGYVSDVAKSTNDPKAWVRELQRYSMQEKGMTDIAYNYVLMANGAVYEGRGLRYRSAANGTADGNVKYAAVIFPGDYRTGKNTLTAAQITSFRALRQHVLGSAPQAKDLKPHSFFKATECPGQNIVSAIPALSQLPPDPLPPPRPVLRRGSTGDSVRCLQRSLNNWGGAKLTVDGVFGPVTEAAVLRYQKAHGLVQDGVVGNQTWRSLEQYGGCEAD